MPACPVLRMRSGRRPGGRAVAVDFDSVIMLYAWTAAAAEDEQDAATSQDELEAARLGCSGWF